MPRKLLSILVLVMFLVTCLGAGAGAAEVKAGKSLEEAINIAKKSFSVPAEYNDFSSYYNEYGEKSAWSLTWRGKEGEMNIEVDAKSGQIVRMYRYSAGDQRSIKLPAINYQEAKNLAAALVKQLLPSKAKDLVLKEDPQRPALDINPWGPPRYNLRYERRVEGIPFPNNGVNITVNGDTGEILNYNFDWYEGALKVPGKLISAGEAREIFQREFPLELIYFRPQAADKKAKPAIKLVYQLRNPAGVLIDPVTGQAVPPEEWNEVRFEDMGAGGEQASLAMKEALTPEEAEEVSAVEALISKEEAGKIALQVLKLDSSYKLNSSSLQRSWDEPDQIVWQLSWQKMKDNEYKAYAGATVDGSTGELLGFTHHRFEQGGDQEPAYDFAQAQELAGQLIAALQPEKAEEIRLAAPEASKEQKPARSYHFVYERLVRGIPFPQNGFQVSVNGVTGQVESYNLRWTGAKFPAADTVIDPAQATAWYGEEVPPVLEFVTSYSYDADQTKVNLVYHLSKVPYTMLDGVSGMPLDWNGEAYEKAKAAIFTDIAAHPARAEIELLASAGVLEGTDDGLFKPDNPLTQGELAKILAKLTVDRGPIIPLPRLALDPDAWHTRWINDVVGKGLLKEDEVDPEEVVVKELLAVTLVRYLGLTKAAELPELYRLRFGDTEEMTAAYRGYIALADGLQIIPSGENFQPKQPITRAAAVIALVKTLQLD